MASEQIKIEEYTDEKLERVSKELMEELSDDAEKIKKQKMLAELQAMEKRIVEKRKQVEREVRERKQQVKLFSWEEDDDNDEEI